MRTALSLVGGLAVAALLVTGCQAPAESQLAGRWSGRILSKTSREDFRRFEDFELTILPNGRFASVGMFSTSQADKAGDRVPVASPPGASACVLDADYTPTSSSVTLAMEADTEEDRLRSGGTQTAHLREDGRLEYRMFAYVLAIGDPRQSDAISHLGLLSRVPEGAATTQPAEE